MSGRDPEVVPVKGDLAVVRRFVPLLWLTGLSLALALLGMSPAFAQDGKAKAEIEKAAAPEVPKHDASAVKEQPKAESPKKEAEKPKEAEKLAEAPLPTVPKEVEEKLDKARKALAEAIVAAEDAGLVDTSIDPPPILDILVKGYAIDARTLKNPAAKKNYWALTPEVFCGWFTGYGKSPEGVTINPQTDLRIVNPSSGLKTFFDQRASMLNRYIEEVRKAKGPAPAPATAPAPAPAAAPTPAPKPAEVKKEEAKPDEVKKN
jgi:hypothetical protein